MVRFNMRTQFLFLSLSCPGGRGEEGGPGTTEGNVVIFLVLVLRVHGAGGRIEGQFHAIGLVEVEPILDGAGRGVDGAHRRDVHPSASCPR